MEAKAELLPGDEGGEPWPLPEGWVWTKLGNILPINYGKALPAADRSGSGEFTVFGSSGAVGSHHDYIAPSKSIIIGRKGSAGAIFFSENPCWPIDTAYFSVGTPAVDIRFGYRFLQFRQLGRLDQSTAIPSLSRDIYNVQFFSLAPLTEQRRIVDRIDGLFAEIAEGEAALTEARKGVETFRKALLKAAVTGELTKDWREQNPVTETGHDLLARIEKTRTTSPVANGRRRRDVDASPIKVSELPCLPRSWAWTTLGEIADVVGGATVDRKRKPVDPITVPYLRVANVQRGRVDLSEVKSITVEQSFAKKLSLKIGDLLLNEGGDRDKIGRGWVWEGSVPLMIHQNHVFRARLLDSSFNPYFFSHYSNELGRRYFIDEGKQTTNLASISLSKITLLPVPVPPPAEAAEILRRVTEALSAADDTLAMLDAEAANAARLKQAILKAAFEGRLVNQDPSDEPASTLLARLRSEGLASKPARKKGVIDMRRSDRSHAEANQARSRVR